MARLVVNPNSPAGWEIQLKPGTNTIGRGFANDFKISDPSVSGSHCQIIVNNGNATIKDLGSTNGTFVNRAPVTEAPLQQGQTIHLGGVEMVFHADAPAYVNVPETTPGLAYPPPPPVPVAPTMAATTGPQYCKSHPKTLGRFFCNNCQVAFCEMCVTTRNVGGAPHKYCRRCGAECSPLRVQTARAAGSKGFFARLPGVFVYPFKGSGLLILIVATVVFAALDIVSSGFVIFLKMAALGYLFSYMQNIIHCTAAEEAEMPSLPDFDGLFGAFFTLAGTVVFCFAIPIALAIAKIFFEVEIPASAFVATIILSCLYFPMAFLAVAMKDTVMAANPLLVIPSIFKVPWEYLVTALLLMAVFGVRGLGSLMSSFAQGAGYSTRDMSVLFISFGFRAIWSFLSIYLLTVGMRILGILYLTKKQKLGWFEH